jgi:transposase
MVHDLRELLRIAAGKHPQPTTTVYDGQTLQGTIETGKRAGYDGHKKKTGSKVHATVDSLGYLMALVVTPANEHVHSCVKQERHQVEELSRQVQEVTGKSIKLAWVDQGYTGPEAATAAGKHGIELEVVKLPKAKKGFVLLPYRWIHTRVNEIVERSFSWKSRFRRLVRDYERLPQTVSGLHFLAFACLMLKSLLGKTLSSP